MANLTGGSSLIEPVSTSSRPGGRPRALSQSYVYVHPITHKKYEIQIARTYCDETGKPAQPIPLQNPKTFHAFTRTFKQLIDSSPELSSSAEGKLVEYDIVHKDGKIENIQKTVDQKTAKLPSEAASSKIKKTYRKKGLCEAEFSPVQSEVNPADRKRKESRESSETEEVGADSLFSLLQSEFPTHLGHMIDVLSEIRNSATIAEIFQHGGNLFNYAGTLSKPIQVFGAVGGALSALSGTIGAVRSVAKARFAWEIGDREGVAVHGGVATPMAASYAAVGAFLFSAKVLVLNGAVAASKVSILALQVAGLSMSIFLAIQAAFGLYITNVFSSELEDALDLGTGSEKRALRKALHFLEDKIILTEKDRELCRSSGQTLENCLKAKHAFIERRTSEKCLNELKRRQAEIHSMIQELRKAKPDSEIKNQAMELIKFVYGENYRTKIYYCFRALTAAVGVSAFITTMVCTGGLGNLFFFIGAILWLTMDSPEFSKMIGDFIWEHRKELVYPVLLQTPDAAPSLVDKLKFLAIFTSLMLTSPLWAYPLIIYLEGSSFYRKCKKIYVESSERERKLAQGYSLVSAEDKKRRSKSRRRLSERRILTA